MKNWKDCTVCEGTGEVKDDQSGRRVATCEVTPHEGIDDDDERRDECWQCGGEGWGVIGSDWDSDDYVNGPYPGELQECPCCRGSGLAKDCTYC